MLSWINKQGVKSDSGYVLQGMHRYYYHYIENDHVMVIYVEPGKIEYKDYYETVILSSFNKWEAPYDKEELSKEKIKEIIKNVDNALTFMGIRHEFGGY